MYVASPLNLLARYFIESRFTENEQCACRNLYAWAKRSEQLMLLLDSLKVCISRFTENDQCALRNLYAWAKHIQHHMFTVHLDSLKFSILNEMNTIWKNSYFLFLGTVYSKGVVYERICIPCDVWNVYCKRAALFHDIACSESQSWAVWQGICAICGGQSSVTRLSAVVLVWQTLTGRFWIRCTWLCTNLYPQSMSMWSTRLHQRICQWL